MSSIIRLFTGLLLSGEHDQLGVLAWLQLFIVLGAVCFKNTLVFSVNSDLAGGVSWSD